jgi:hypothetical protein
LPCSASTHCVFVIYLAGLVFLTPLAMIINRKPSNVNDLSLYALASDGSIQYLQFRTCTSSRTAKKFRT